MPATIIQYVVPAPYSTATQIGELLGNPGNGILLAVRPEEGITPRLMVQHIVSCQRRAQRTTICLWLDLIAPERIPEYYASASNIGVRGYYVGTDIDEPRLRDQIADPTNLASDFIWRLQIMGFPPNVMVNSLVHASCRHVQACASLGDMMKLEGLEYKPLQRACNRAAFGSPAFVYQIIRLLSASLALQRSPQVPISDIAHSFEFWDAAHLRHRFGDLFGTPPNVVRQWIGWENLLAVAIRRCVTLGSYKEVSSRTTAGPDVPLREG